MKRLLLNRGQILLIAWSVGYMLSLFCFLAAIWADGPAEGNLGGSGAVLLVYSAVMMVVWGGTEKNWFEDW